MCTFEVHDEADGNTLELGLGTLSNTKSSYASPPSSHSFFWYFEEGGSLSEMVVKDHLRTKR